MKISHKQLESCRLSPKSWVASRQVGSGWRPRFSYRQALNFAISAFHVTNSLAAATAKIDGYATKFKNAKKIEMLYQSLDEYANWFQSSGIISADSNVTIAYPYVSNWQLGGLISRVDVLKSGYRAVLFEGIPSGWKDQLRMPLIQTAIAERYGRLAAEIKVGFQDLNGNLLTDTLYSLAQRRAALSEFQQIGAQVAKLLPISTP